MGAMSACVLFGKSAIQSIQLLVWDVGLTVCVCVCEFVCVHVSLCVCVCVRVSLYVCM